MDDHDAVAIDFPCPGCRAPAQLAAAQSSRSGQFRFATSLHCRSCNHASESDDNSLPDEFREAFYRQSGKWMLVLVASDVSMPSAAQAVARVLSVTSMDALRLLKQPGTTLSTGTRVELHARLEILARNGIASVLKRVS